MPLRWPSPTPRTRRRAVLLLCAGGLGLLLPWLVRWLDAGAGLLFWGLDLAAHWQWLFAPLLLLGALLLAGHRRYYLLALPLACLPWWTAAPRLPAGDAGVVFSVASVNVHLSTQNVDRLAPWLAEQAADVVVLLEVSPALAKDLARLDGYPHRVVHAEASPFGIALLSRHPFLSTKMVPGDDGIVHIAAEIALAGENIGVLAFHPMPPLSLDFHRLRDSKLQHLIAAAGERPTLLAGDLNATPWSSAMQALAPHGWRRASGLQPTWPQWGMGVLGIPIDQVLASPGWAVESSAVGPALGSDHLPLIVRLRRLPAGAG